ncbi:ADP-ribosylation factor-like protein [Pochonia chlamydosporia 170]|uniref:ADP-ribosylation factor-like protein n=1 Tax=Pochonia chlamydosporia 170 TaxID=1380566 RepID=A0A179F3G1_METCM|nr:ADP-ribosylation factor-like protein [Pochonia chlamydosporia 170]OAQ59954.1 ADP-ribosylation factor-like protein [Pochonia chlamydosporia 170]
MEMEVVVTGLKNAGKTSLLKVLMGGEFTFDSTPTMRHSTKRLHRDNVTLICRDISSHPKSRRLQERYCHGVDVIIFIVDMSDIPLISQAKYELHGLMSKESLRGVPLLVLGSKFDLPQKLSMDELIDELDLAKIRSRAVYCYGISAKERINLDEVIQFLLGWAG